MPIASPNTTWNWTKLAAMDHLMYKAKWSFMSSAKHRFSDGDLAMNLCLQSQGREHALFAEPCGPPLWELKEGIGEGCNFFQLQ